MKTLLFVICAFSLFFYSCDHSKDTKQYLSRIDSLSLALEKSASDFETIDTASIHKKYQLIDEQLEMLYASYNNYDQASVSNYNNIRKTFSDVADAYPDIINELAYTRSQLSDLKYDIENGLLSQEKTQMYFSQEKRSVRVLKLKMDFYRKQLKSGFNQIEHIYPEMKNRIDSLTQ